MKRYRLSLLVISAIAATCSAYGAGYSTNFDSFTQGDIVGQDGWAVNDQGTLDSGTIVSSFIGGNPNAASLGNSEVTASTVFMSKSVSLAMNGASFSVDFTIQDSTVDFPNRDTFGFYFENAAGDNLMTTFLLPTGQDPTPGDSLAVHNLDWSSETVGATPSPFAVSEAQLWNLKINFTQSGANMLFNANLNGGLFSGVLVGMAGETITEFGAFWTPLDLDDEGNNTLLFDNISLVPEPSSALLGLAGAAFAFGRRRRA